MANWCYTSMDISAPSAQIEAVEAMLAQSAGCGTLKSDFGPGWLGNIYELLGFDEDQICHHLPCRGSILHSERVDDQTLRLEVETAWGPQVSSILMLCDCFAPDADITITAEEPNMDLFITNDRNLAGKYYVDLYDDPDDGFPEEFTELDDLVDGDWIKEVIAENLGRSSGCSLEDLLKDFFKKYDCCGFHEYEYADLEDFRGGEQ